MGTGGCWCERIRYEYEGDPEYIVQCHCQTCQKISGGPFTVNAMFPKSMVKIVQGEQYLRQYTGKHVMGTDVTAYFCSVCSSNLWKALQADMSEGLYVIQTGTLDGPNGQLGADVLPPREEGFKDCRASWLPRVPDLKQLG